MLWTENLFGSEMELKFAVTPPEAWFNGVFCLRISEGVPVSKSKITGEPAATAIGVNNSVATSVKSDKTINKAEDTDRE